MYGLRGPAIPKDISLNSHYNHCHQLAYQRRQSVYRRAGDIWGQFFGNKSDQNNVQLQKDGPEFVQIDVDSEGGLGGTSEQVFGPLALVLVGYTAREFDRFRQMMIEMEADMVKIICCSNEEMGMTLVQVLEGPAGAFRDPPIGQRRAAIFSGMYGSEVVDVIAEYKDQGLPPTVFAAAVPGNADSLVKDLVDELYDDDRFVKQQQQQMQQQQ
eukprot:TRINITY_DN9457_c0_g1_i1.p2 TRINITY_DN9457_c0_g1~~TRINITY_DN9457_c0_g1_i1.p2  ORF type:complete len:231 (+),score=21.07 TRINITY_DN9457_c0_g1_i1:56-694(+)